MMTRRRVLGTLALILPGVRALHAAQTAAKLATVTLIIEGMT